MKSKSKTNQDKSENIFTLIAKHEDTPFVQEFYSQNNGKLYKFFYLEMLSHKEVKEWEEVTTEHDEKVNILFEFDFMIFENLDAN